MSEWQPIETAPRDGRSIFVKLSDGTEIRGRAEAGGLAFQFKDLIQGPFAAFNSAMTASPVGWRDLS